MKLTIEHLKGYLDTGLEVMYHEDILDVHGIIGNDIFHNDMGDIPLSVIKPILTPLSEFEYEHIIQIKEHLGIGQWCDYYDQYFDAWFDDSQSVQKLVLQCPYEIMQFFLECHFDVFGLIDQNLAIDKKTLKA